MADVRAFKKEDIAEVADLYAEVFLHGQDVDVGGLRLHFEEVHFDNPFHDDDIPSLVYTDETGAITAFLGVMPRPMRFRGGTIKTAIAGNLMIKGKRVDPPPDDSAPPPHAHQFAPVALVKAFFRTPFDLYLADSAIDVSKRIWERCGGHAVPLYSLRWLRLLKPFRFGLDRLGNQGRFRALTRLGTPIATLLDHTAKSMIAPETRSLPEGLSIDRLEPEDVIDALDSCRHYDLVPRYSRDELDWVLAMARSRKRYGTLESFAVRGADRRLLGFAIYYGVPGGIGRVLQFHAVPKAIGPCFDCLLYHAAENGIAALSGKVDPSMIDHFSARRWALSFNAWTLIHARDPEIVQAFLTGKALFSELESEGWTRFVHARPKREFTAASS